MLIGGHLAWTKLEVRLTKLERGFEAIMRIHDVTRAELIQAMKQVNSLEGRHKEHVERHRRLVQEK